MGKQLHIVMYPWLAMGHFIPYLHLSNKLAERGLKITLILPNKAKLKLDHFNLHPSLITLHPITVPHVDPLPPGAETCSDIPFHLEPHLATVIGAASLAYGVLKEMPITEDDVASPPPGYPSTSVVLRRQTHETESVLHVLGLEYGSGLTLYDRISTAATSSDAMVFQTCKEIEAKFCEYLASQTNKPIFLTGPICLALDPAHKP